MDGPVHGHLPGPRRRLPVARRVPALRRFSGTRCEHWRHRVSVLQRPGVESPSWLSVIFASVTTAATGPPGYRTLRPPTAAGSATSATASICAPAGRTATRTARVTTSSASIVRKLFRNGCHTQLQAIVLIDYNHSIFHPSRAHCAPFVDVRRPFNINFL